MNKETINSKRIQPLAAQRNQSGEVIDGKIYCSTPKRSPCAKSLRDVLAARSPAMQPTLLVSRLEDTLGWRWSMEFNSPDDETVFWDGVSVAEIRNLVALKSKASRTPPASGLRVVRRNPKPKN